MTWTLAIDFGTTATAAAIYDGDVELIQVDGMARLPSLVLLGTDGEPVCGTAAERQAAGAPERVERTPKRRLGDRMLLLGDQAVDPVDLVAAVLRKVADEARRRQGGADPTQVVLTHPAAWVGARLAALREAARRADLGEVTLVPEPVAAAIHLADDRIVEGDHVAVYDLGGGTFDTAVLRRTASGFEPVGAPGGDEHLGGEDFDELLYDDVAEILAARDPERWQLLRSSDERTWVRANAALRDEVRVAKEALSSSAEYTIYVPGLDQEVRVTREQVEELVRPSLERSVDELVATVERAGLRVADVKAVYLVGGSSRMPLAARLISERTGLVPLTWGDPKAAVALGAAQRGRGAAEASPVVLTAPSPPPPAASPPVSTLEVVGVAAGGNGRRLVLAGVALAIVVALVALVAVLPSRGGVDDEVATDETVPSTTTTIGPNGELEHVFVSSEADGVRTERTWRVDPAAATLASEVSLTNLDASAEISRTVFEVIPKEVATDVAQVSFDPAPAEVVQVDPIVRYDVTIPGGGSQVLRWSVSTPADLGVEAFEAMVEARDTEERSYFQRLLALGQGGGDVVLPPVTEPVRPGAQPTTPTNKPSTGGGVSGGSTETGGTSGTSGTSGGASTTVTERTSETAATAPPVNSTTTPPTTTAGPAISKPGEVASLVAKDPVGEEYQDNVATTVRVTLQWSPPSDDGGQAPTQYKIRCTTMQGTAVYTGPEPAPCKGGMDHSTTSGSATSASVVAGRIDVGQYMWMKWEVAAVNSAGTGDYRKAQAVVPLVVGLFSWEAWPLVRVVGISASGGFPMTCGRQQYQICEQSKAAGTTIASGVDMAMSEQQ